MLLPKLVKVGDGTKERIYTLIGVEESFFLGEV